MKLISLIPRISEKAYSQSVKGNVYVFNVDSSLNKIEIKQAVESQHGVEVNNVRMLNRKGKKARSVRIGRRSSSRPVYGRRSDQKLAYVTVKAGDKINISAFEEVDNNAA
jgi:ribosomal protein L23